MQYSKHHTHSTTMSTSCFTTTEILFTKSQYTAEDNTTSTPNLTSSIVSNRLDTTKLTSSLPSTSTVITEYNTTMKPVVKSRIGGQRRRKNMTLYILTSDEHKIRQFSINHTRGILINCNQLRRRLLGRRLRDILLTTTNYSALARHISSGCHVHVYSCLLIPLLTLISYFFS
jgi:hypothetical protein